LTEILKKRIDKRKEKKERSQKKGLRSVRFRVETGRFYLGKKRRNRRKGRKKGNERRTKLPSLSQKEECALSPSRPRLKIHRKGKGNREGVVEKTPDRRETL